MQKKKEASPTHHMQIIVCTEAADQNCRPALLNQKDGQFCHGDWCCRVQAAVRVNISALPWLPRPIGFFSTGNGTDGNRSYLSVQKKHCDRLHRQYICSVHGRGEFCPWPVNYRLMHRIVCSSFLKNHYRSSLMLGGSSSYSQDCKFF